MPNWIKEHFTVSHAMPLKRGIKSSLNKLVNYYNEPVKYSWYPQKLQTISSNQYRIEKALQRRLLSENKIELFARWEG